MPATRARAPPPHAFVCPFFAQRAALPSYCLVHYVQDDAAPDPRVLLPNAPITVLDEAARMSPPASPSAPAAAATLHGPPPCNCSTPLDGTLPSHSAGPTASEPDHRTPSLACHTEGCASEDTPSETRSADTAGLLLNTRGHVELPASAVMTLMPPAHTCVAEGRTCTLCGTSATPKWRGAQGNVCNACGLAERKKNRRAESPAPAYARAVPRPASPATGAPNSKPLATPRPSLTRLHNATPSLEVVPPRAGLLGENFSNFVLGFDLVMSTDERVSAMCWTDNVFEQALFPADAAVPPAANGRCVRKKRMTQEEMFSAADEVARYLHQQMQRRKAAAAAAREAHETLAAAAKGSKRKAGEAMAEKAAKTAKTGNDEAEGEEDTYEEDKFLTLRKESVARRALKPARARD